MRLAYLGADPALADPVEVSVRPGAVAPRRDESQVVGEVDRVQLVVDELADVPGEVVVPVAAAAEEKAR